MFSNNTDINNNSNSSNHSNNINDSSSDNNVSLPALVYPCITHTMAYQYFHHRGTHI